MTFLLNTIIESGTGIGHTRLHVSLDQHARSLLTVTVDTQTDRFRRVRATWEHPQHEPEELMLAYLDRGPGSRAVLTPEQVAAMTDARMHAHTLHGTDWRKLREAGVLR